MPQVRYYTVTQEREVKVAANSALEAAQAATAAFDKTDTPENTTVRSDVRVRTLDVREDY